MNDHKPTHLDLFSGIGGFALAAQWAGFQTIAFCEIEPYAQQILKEKFSAVMADTHRSRKSQPLRSIEELRRWAINESEEGNGPRLHSDIFTLNGADYAGVDLLTGGFPCQPFSCAGKRRGMEDDRHLWPQMLRVIQEARPAWVLGENVAGIINMELDRVLSDLESIGYACWPLVIPACAVDARHRRDRVWIVGYAKSQRAQGYRPDWEQESSAHAGEGLPVRPSKDVSNPTVRSDQPRGAQCHKRKLENGNGTTHWGSCHWIPEPDVGRVAHGVPNRTHRLRSLGNAIVPQVAYEILKAIRQLIPCPTP